MGTNYSDLLYTYRKLVAWTAKVQYLHTINHYKEQIIESDYSVDHGSITFKTYLLHHQHLLTVSRFCQYVKQLALQQQSDRFYSIILSDF